MRAVDHDEKLRLLPAITALGDHLEQLLLELRCGVEVDLAGERDDVGVLAELLCLDVEVHPRVFPRSRST